MTTSQLSPKVKLELDLHEIGCQIRFLSESIPTWIKGDFSPSDEAAYGLETIMAGIADKVTGLYSGNPISSEKNS